MASFLASSVAGVFENYVNTESAPARHPLAGRIMEAVNEVSSSRQFAMTSSWAGSVQKHTYVDGYSDLDIWIETGTKIMTSTMRIKFSELIVEKLQEMNIPLTEEGPAHKLKPTATAFYAKELDFDIVFSRSDWANPRVVVPPNDRHFRLQLQRQRANGTRCPKLSGVRVENLVIAASEHVPPEDTSRYALFMASLAKFRDASGAGELVKFVVQNAPAGTMPAGDTWKLRAQSFDCWKSSSTTILQKLQQLEARRVTAEDLISAFRVPVQIAVENLSTSASYPSLAPFASGEFRWVAKGEYTNGPRIGEDCVCKWFKTGSVVEELFFEKDIKVVNKAVEIIRDFNKDVPLIVDGRSKVVRINLATVWTFLPGSSSAGQKYLNEPFIHNWTKFNSNTGWTGTSSPWQLVMQALSHYSYHISGGELVLCDLQGGEDEDGVILSDPVILSKAGGNAYGATDLGPEGISTFFGRHRCNEFCDSKWSKPADKSIHFEAKEGSHMAVAAPPVTRVPTAARMAAFEECDEEDG